MPEVYKRLAVADFDPTVPIDPEIEQFLRVNIEAYRDVLPQWIAHVIRVSAPA